MNISYQFHFILSILELIKYLLFPFEHRFMCALTFGVVISLLL